MRPIDKDINLWHTIDGTVVIERIEKGDVGKRGVGIDFLEAYSSSRQQDLKKLWRKNNE